MLTMREVETYSLNLLEIIFCRASFLLFRMKESGRTSARI